MARGLDQPLVPLRGAGRGVAAGNEVVVVLHEMGPDRRAEKLVAMPQRRMRAPGRS